MKRLLTVGIGVLVLASCGGEEPQQEIAETRQDVEAESTEEQTTEVDTTTSDSVMFGEAPERDDEYYEDTSLEDETLGILQEAYEGRGKVSYDKDNSVFIIEPSDPSMMDVVSDIEAGGSTDNWDDIVSEIVALSESISETLGSGYYIHYKLPFTQGGTLILVKDGVLLYDFADEL